MNSQQKRDVLYLKRTPTVTYDSTSGAPIPESIKKFYVQQQLPVRKQSLAANHNSRLDYRKRLHPQSLPRHHSHIPKTNTHLSDIIEDLGVGKNLVIQEEQDEFNFKGRPPSSVISIQPIDVDDEEEEEEEEEEEDEEEAAIKQLEWETSTMTTTTPIRRKGKFDPFFFLRWSLYCYFRRRFRFFIRSFG